MVLNLIIKIKLIQVCLEVHLKLIIRKRILLLKRYILQIYMKNKKLSNQH